MSIPKHDEWMKTTELGFRHPRSNQLRRVDKSLEAYWKTPGHHTQKMLRAAINDWVRKEGDGWKRSKRNKGGIVERLRVNAFSGFPPPMTPEERAAMAYWDAERRQAVQRNFRGKRITLKNTRAREETKSAFDEVKSAMSNVRSLASGGASGSTSGSADSRGVVESMLKEAFDTQTIGAIAPELMQTFGTDVVSSLVPIVSQVWSARDVMIAWGKVAKAKREEIKTASHGYAVAAGDPQAAFQALERMLDRATTAEGVQAGIVTTDFAFKAVMTLVDGGTFSGPASGIAKATAKLGHKIFLLGREYQESTRANALLADPNRLDLRLFETYPLLGCYMLAGSDLSDIVSMLGVQFGSFGWMDEIEELKRRHIDPIRRKAFTFIDGSIYEIPDMKPRVAQNNNLPLKLAKSAFTTGKELYGHYKQA